MRAPKAVRDRCLRIVTHACATNEVGVARFLYDLYNAAVHDTPSAKASIKDAWTRVKAANTAKDVIAPLPGGTMNMLPHAIYGPRPWQVALSLALAATLPAAEPRGYQALAEKAEVKLGEPFQYTVQIRHDPKERYDLDGEPKLDAEFVGTQLVMVR